MSADGKNVMLRTNFGEFRIDASQSLVTVVHGKSIRHVPFDTIYELDYRRTETSSAVEDFIDQSYGNKHSHIEWYEIALRLVGGEMIPVYKIGQYQIHAIYRQVEWIVKLWRKIGSYTWHYRDLRKISSDVLQTIQSRFSAAGKHLMIRDAEQGVAQKPDLPRVP